MPLEQCDCRGDLGRGVGRQLSNRGSDLPPHGPILIIETPQEGGLHRVSTLAEPALREPDAGDTDVAKRILQRLNDGGGFDCIHGVQSPHGMKARAPVRRLLGALFQTPHDGTVVPFDEDPLCGVAPPAVRVRQRLHELRGRGLRESGHARITLRPLMDDAVDAAVARRAFQVARQDLIAQVLGDVALVLNDPVIHVDDVEQAVGC